MRTRTWLLSAAAAAMLGVTTPTLAQSVTSVEPPSENLSRLYERVSELDGMLRAATAENERLNIELARLRSENAALKNQLEPSAPSEEGVGGATGLPAEEPASVPRPQPAATQATGVGAPLGAAAARPAPTPPAPVSAPAPTSAERYKAAEQLLQQSRWPEAEQAFAAFVAAYPNAPETADARYWLGRTQIVQNRYSDAAGTFVDLLRRYPNSKRGPDAWVRLGIALNGMGQKQQACATFADLPVRYPNAAPAVRQLATTQARDAKCTA